MTYYLSGALASQNSASINQAITGALPTSVNDFASPLKENLTFDISPNGEYLLKTSFMGTGSFASDPGNDYDPGIIIYQSGSSNGFEIAGFIRNKGFRGNDSSVYYADLHNQYNAQFLSDGVIVWAGGSYDPQDGSGYVNDGIFGVITGSGTSWGIHKIFSGSTQTGTAQSRSENLGSEADIGDFKKTSEHGYLIEANNKYNDTLATRVAVYNGFGHKSAADPQGIITIFQQSGGTWSFHSQFNQVDLSDYVDGTFNSAMSVHDMTWIDENNLVVVYYSDGSTDYSYMMALTWNASTSKWEISGYNGSDMTNYAYRLATELNPDTDSSGVQGIRYVEYDPFSERLLMGYQGDSIWMFQSASNWLRDDLYGTSFGKGNTSEEEDHGHAGISGAVPWGTKHHLRFMFGEGRTTVVGLRKFSGFSSTANRALNFLFYHESSSAGGWIDYSVSGFGDVQNSIKHEHFSTGSLSLAAEPYAGWGITPFQVDRDNVNNHGMKTSFTINNRNGGSGNDFVYHEGDHSQNGAYQADTQRLLVGNFGAFPASNPALAASVTSTIGTSGGTVSAGGTEASPDASVTIPTNALGGDTSITVDLETENSNVATNGIRRIAGPAAQAYSQVVEVTPHGQSFSSAVTLTFKLSGSVAGTCPADLKVYKSNSDSGAWYQLPDNLWSCSSGAITISATSFSRYQAIGGSNTMARSKLNNFQIKKLVDANMVLGGAVDITGSSDTKAAVVSADKFLIQGTSGIPQQISASTMQAFFSKVDLTEASGSTRHSIVMALSGSTDDADLYVDAGIEYLPASGSFFIHGDMEVEGGKLTLSNGATIDSETAGELKLTEDQISVIGALSGSGAASFAGALNVDGAADLDGTLNVEGVSTFAADVTASAGLHINGGAVANSMIVEDLTDNRVVLAGTGGELEDSASLTFDGSTLAADAAISGSGALSAGGALDIAGTAAIGDKLTVEANGMAVTGAVGMSSTLSVSGIATFAADVTASAGLSVAGALDVDGATTLDGLTVAEVATFSADITASAGLQVAQEADLNGALTVAGTADFASSVTVEGNLVVNGTTTTIDSQNLQVEDPMILLGSGAAGEGAAGDRGLLMAISGANNPAMYWDNSESQFAFVQTTASGITNSVTPADYSDLRIGGLTADDASSIGGVLTVTGDITASAGLSVAQEVAITGDLDVDGATTLDGLTVAEVATFSADITASAGLQVAQEADLNGALTVAGTADLASSLSVAGRTDLNGIVSLGDSSADAVYVSGTFEIGSTSTVLGSNQIKFTNLDDLDESTVASGDMFMIRDIDANGYAKEITIADVGHYFAQSGSTQGIQVDNSTGKLSIDYVEDIITSASATAGLTASLSQEPLADSVHVYLNGQLQARSGSGVGVYFDFVYAGSEGSRRVEFANALDADDVVQLKYIKK